MILYFLALLLMTLLGSVASLFLKKASGFSDLVSLINPHAKCLSTTRNETEVLDLAVGRLYTRSTAKVDSFLGFQPD